MQFSDSLTLDAPKRTSDGFLAVRAKAARSGIYEYTGAEVDPAGERFKSSDVVKVYRPETEVFDKASVHSFLQKPVTNNHPAQPVTADNWKAHAGGVIANALRDGEHLAFDLVLMDSALIKQVEDGKRELSNGYSCNLVFGDGVAPDGTAYQATQTNIRGNHIAVVDKGRAGPECRIGDEKPSGGNAFAICDANPAAIISSEGSKMKIMLDGLHVDLSDADAVKAAFDKVKGDADKALADSVAELTAAKDSVATLTAEKVALEKQVADAKAAAEAIDLDKLVADRAALVAKAKEIKADIVTDGKSNDEIRKDVVTASLGDAAADFDAKQIEAAFMVIAKDAKPAVVSLANPAKVNDAGDAVATARKAWLDAKANAHRAA